VVGPLPCGHSALGGPPNLVGDAWSPAAAAGAGAPSGLEAPYSADPYATSPVMELRLLSAPVCQRRLGYSCGFNSSRFGGVMPPPSMWLLVRDGGLLAAVGFFDCALEVGARSGRIWHVKFTIDEVCGGPCYAMARSRLQLCTGQWSYRLDSTGYAGMVALKLRAKVYAAMVGSGSSGESFDPSGSGDGRHPTSLTSSGALPRRPRSHMHFLWVG
jgi:hypothetical protein